MTKLEEAKKFPESLTNIKKYNSWENCRETILMQEQPAQ